MPAGTDIVTWSPRVGATGDDRYSVPASTGILAGATDGYSGTPTITEVNAGSAFNQIGAEIKRRGGSASYVAAGDFVLATTFNTWKTQIDTIRSNEKRSAFSWSELPVSAGDVIKTDAIKELRKALATDFIYLVADSTNTGLKKLGNPYPPSSLFLQSDGKVGQGKSGQYSILRTAILVTVPTGLPSLDSGKMVIKVSTDYVGTNFDARLYRSSSDLRPIDTGDWGNLDNLEDTVGTSGMSDETYEEWSIAAPASGAHTYWLVSARDENGDQPTGNEFLELRNVTYLKLYTAS